MGFMMIAVVAVLGGGWWLWQQVQRMQQEPKQGEGRGRNKAAHDDQDEELPDIKREQEDAWKAYEVMRTMERLLWDDEREEAFVDIHRAVVAGKQHAWIFASRVEKKIRLKPGFLFGRRGQLAAAAKQKSRR